MMFTRHLKIKEFPSQILNLLPHKANPLKTNLNRVVPHNLLQPSSPVCPGRWDLSIRSCCRIWTWWRAI